MPASRCGSVRPPRTPRRRSAITKSCAGCAPPAPWSSASPASPSCASSARPTRRSASPATRGTSPHARWLVRWLGRRGRVRHGAARARQRRHGLDPHPGRLLRPRRHQARPRRRAGRSRQRLVVRHGRERPAGHHRRGRRARALACWPTVRPSPPSPSPSGCGSRSRPRRRCSASPLDKHWAAADPRDRRSAARRRARRRRGRSAVRPDARALGHRALDGGHRTRRPAGRDRSALGCAPAGTPPSAGRSPRPAAAREGPARWQHRAEQFFADHDVLITPTLAQPPIEAKAWAERGWLANIWSNARLRTVRGAVEPGRLAGDVRAGRARPGRPPAGRPAGRPARHRGTAARRGRPARATPPVAPGRRSLAACDRRALAAPPAARRRSCVLVFRLALRALVWRAAASATVFAVALIGILAAAVGPIYLHAVDETVLSQRLLEAPQNARDIHITQQTLIGTERRLALHGAQPARPRRPTSRGSPRRCSPRRRRSTTTASSATPASSRPSTTSARTSRSSPAGA